MELVDPNPEALDFVDLDAPDRLADWIDASPDDPPFDDTPDGPDDQDTSYDGGLGCAS